MAWAVCERLAQTTVRGPNCLRITTGGPLAASFDDVGTQVVPPYRDTKPSGK